MYVGGLLNNVEQHTNNNNNNNNLMLISRKFTFIYDQMRVTTVEIKITLYE